MIIVPPCTLARSLDMRRSVEYVTWELHSPMSIITVSDKRACLSIGKKRSEVPGVLNLSPTLVISFKFRAEESMSQSFVMYGYRVCLDVTSPDFPAQQVLKAPRLLARI